MIEFEFAPPDFDKILDAEAEEIVEDVFDRIARDAPAEMKSMMQASGSGKVYMRRGRLHQASAPGEAPAIDTGGLFRSIAGWKRGKDSAEISMEWYGEFLDAERNRIFIEPAIDTALSKQPLSI